MKARKRGTDNPFEEVETIQLKGSYVLNKAYDMEFENEGISTSVDWEQVRINAAIAAMQGLMSDRGNLQLILEWSEKDKIECSNEAAKVAVKYADALVEKLREEKL